MRWVDQIPERPYRCAVVPYIGNGSGHSFLQTGQQLDLEGVYISDVACEAIAQALGWTPPAMFRALQQQAADLQQRLEASQAEVEELQAFKDGVAGLTQHGLVVRKPQGRKPKVEA